MTLLCRRRSFQGIDLSLGHFKLSKQDSPSRYRTNSVYFSLDGNREGASTHLGRYPAETAILLLISGDLAWPDTERTASRAIGASLCSSVLCKECGRVENVPIADKNALEYLRNLDRSRSESCRPRTLSSASMCHRKVECTGSSWTKPSRCLGDELNKSLHHENNGGTVTSPLNVIN